MIKHYVCTTCHLALRVEALAVSADAVPALDTAVGVLGVDLVAVAPVDHGQLREARHRLLGPGAPQRPVPVPVAGDDPAGGVAHLVDQGVPQPVPAVYHLRAQLNPAGPCLDVVFLVSSRKAQSSGFRQAHIPGYVHVVRQGVFENLFIVHLI